MNNTFLPGGNKQLILLLKNINIEGFKILVAGSASEESAMKLAQKSGLLLDLIVEDLDSFMNSSMLIGDDNNVKVRMMDFDSTDFESQQFDLIFAQASITLEKRKKIIKEFKRLLKPEGYFCVGETVEIKDEVPAFVSNIMENSGMAPLKSYDLQSYYEQRGFKQVFAEDLTSSLREFYSSSLAKVKEAAEEFSDGEKSYYKKLVNRIKHESEAYLKLGADKYIGFKVLLLQRVD